jgi:hypothetical protein
MASTRIGALLKTQGGYPMKIFFILWIASGLLSACAHTSRMEKVLSVQKFELKDPPLWGETKDEKKIYAGGLSGLVYLGKNKKNTEYRFVAITDRGPNAEPVGSKRPFLLPQYQPRLVFLETKSSDLSLHITKEIKLTDPNGARLVGLPQLKDKDETAVDMKGAKLGTHEMGIDAESLAQDADGNYWVGEEYRPSILKFNKRGRLLKRYVPKGSIPELMIQTINAQYGKSVIEEKLPEHFANRTMNRGLEALTIREGIVYALMQSELENEKDKFIRLIAFSPKKEEVIAEYKYPVQRKKHFIGDLCLRENGNFVAIEQTLEAHYLTEFALPKNGDQLSVVTIMDLNKEGFAFEKAEGLSFIKDGKNSFFAVINDNDFEVSKPQKTELGIYKINSAAE